MENFWLMILMPVMDKKNNEVLVILQPRAWILPMEMHNNQVFEISWLVLSRSMIDVRNA